MIRNLKVLGLALVAVFAMSALSAQAAFAGVGKITSADGEPFTLTGTNEAEPAVNALTYPGEPAVKCEGAHYHGEKYTEANQPITSGSSTATVTPTYQFAGENACTAGGLPVTVTMEGCDYDLHLGETNGEPDQYKVSSTLTCPTGKHPIVHVYLNAKHTIPLCTINIQPTATDLEGATLTDQTNGHLTLGGTVKGIEASKEGACGAGSTKEAALDLAVTVEGINQATGKTVGLSISHE